MYILENFQSGGGERFLLDLFNVIDHNKVEPVLAWLRKTGGDNYLKSMPSWLKTYDLGLTGHIRSQWEKIISNTANLIRSEQPDIVVSMLNELSRIIFTARKVANLTFPVVLNIHINISSSISFYSLPKRYLLKYLNKQSCRKADLIIPVSQGVADDLINNFGAPKNKIKVIYNGLNLNNIRQLALEEPYHPWFFDDIPIVIGIGRLIEQKGFYYLIRAFKKVVEEVPSRLVILGEGELKEYLEGLVSESGLTQSVCFLGFQPNPFKYLARAKLFVLSSLWEALPYVLLETLALGIPIVSTHCPSGPYEILENGEYGILVPMADENSLADAILKTLGDEKLRRKLSEIGKKRSEDFALDKMAKEYEQCFENLLRS